MHSGSPAWGPLSRLADKMVTNLPVQGHSRLGAQGWETHLVRQACRSARRRLYAAVQAGTCERSLCGSAPDVLSLPRTLGMITDFHAKYFAHELTKRCASDSIEKLAAVLADAQVDLNPHQVEAALFAFRSPFSKGAILADEVGLGKTIEAGLLLAQKWAERKRRLLVIVPASLRKQWAQELAEREAQKLEIKRDEAWRTYDQPSREIDRQKDELLDEIGRRLEQRVEQTPLFTLRWRLT
jgi:hypothetical protein